MLHTAQRPSVQATTAEPDVLTETDRWLILTLLTADPITLPTDVPDLSGLFDGLTSGSE